MHAYTLAAMSDELEKIAGFGIGIKGTGFPAMGTAFTSSRVGTSLTRGNKGLPPVTVTKPIPAPKPMGVTGQAPAPAVPAGGMTSTGAFGKEGSVGHAMAKIARELTEAAREKIPTKNFALSGKQSDTGKPAYPIEDKSHASNALARVKQFGSPAEKAEVYKDVAKKYPDLAQKSSVPALRDKEKDADMGIPMSSSGPPASPLPGMARGGGAVTSPPGNMSTGSS